MGFVRTIRRNEEALAGYAGSMTCHLGDFREYAGIRDEIRTLEKDAAKSRAASVRGEAAISLEKLRVGDVILIPTGDVAGYAVVVQWTPATGAPRRHRRSSPRTGNCAPHPRRRPDAGGARDDGQAAEELQRQEPEVPT